MKKEEDGMNEIYVISKSSSASLISRPPPGCEIRLITFVLVVVKVYYILYMVYI